MGAGTPSLLSGMYAIELNGILVCFVDTLVGRLAYLAHFFAFVLDFHRVLYEVKTEKEGGERKAKIVHSRRPPPKVTRGHPF